VDEAEHGLHDLLLERLLADDAVDDQAAGLILAAWAGDEELASAAAGRPTPAADPTRSPPREQQPDTYLAAVHVEGFRGIGDAATLPLRPGPGLTLVTGRNGSGKSSFAEAAELVMTGDSGRWAGRTTVWRDGWRNLHATGATRISVDLVTAGAHGGTRLERCWEAAAALDGGRWTRQLSGGKRADFDGSEWRADMQTYRPFLSYSELGALIDGKPSELYYALHRLLGLGLLAAAQERLRIARKRLADDAKAVGAARRALRTELSVIGDARGARAVAILAPATPDLATLADLIAGAEDSGGETAILKAIAELEVPDTETVTAAARRVRAAADRVGELADDEISSADRVAAILRTALHTNRNTAPTNARSAFAEPSTTPGARTPTAGHTSSRTSRSVCGRHRQNSRTRSPPAERSPPRSPPSSRAELASTSLPCARPGSPGSAPPASPSPRNSPTRSNAVTEHISTRSPRRAHAPKQTWSSATRCGRPSPGDSARGMTTPNASPGIPHYSPRWRRLRSGCRRPPGSSASSDSPPSQRSRSTCGRCCASRATSTSARCGWTAQKPGAEPLRCKASRRRTPPPLPVAMGRRLGPLTPSNPPVTTSSCHEACHGAALSLGLGHHRKPCYP
jgi:energy-coupling factor transporter ATP-binding protein EcfA2